MRWDYLPKEPGFPTGFNNCPRWLVIPVELSVAFVTALLGNESADNNALLQVLEELLAAQATGSETT